MMMMAMMMMMMTTTMMMSLTTAMQSRLPMQALGFSLVILISGLDVGGQEIHCLLRLGAQHVHAFVTISVAVQLHEFGDVELRFLDDLHLADEDVLEREDALRAFLDLLADHLRDELLDEITEPDGARFLGHDVHHALADTTDLRRHGVAISFDLVRTSLGEGDHKEAHHVPIGGLHVDMSLDQAVPLADERHQLVAGELHAVEVGQAIPALDLLDAQLDLLEALILVQVEVCQVELKHSAAELLRRDLGALSLGDESLAAVAAGEHRWRLDVIPLLLEEGVAGLLLAALLASLGEALVLADRHGCGE